MSFAFLKDIFESWGTPQTVHLRSQPDKFAPWCTSCFALEFSKDSLVCLTVRGKSRVKVAGVQMIASIGNVRTDHEFWFHSTANRCRWKVVCNDIVKEAVHDFLRKFEDRKTDRDGFVQLDLWTSTAHHYQFWIQFQTVETICCWWLWPDDQDRQWDGRLLCFWCFPWFSRTLRLPAV